MDDESDVNDRDVDTPGSVVEGGVETQVELPAPHDTQDRTQTIQNPSGTPPVPSLGSAPVAINVKLDMSAWAVEDALRVLAALGYEGSPRESNA
jgi:hypothetical protein